MNLFKQLLEVLRGMVVLLWGILCLMLFIVFLVTMLTEGEILFLIP